MNAKEEEEAYGQRRAEEAGCHDSLAGISDSASDQQSCFSFRSLCCAALCAAVTHFICVHVDLLVGPLD